MPSRWRYDYETSRKFGRTRISAHAFGPTPIFFTSLHFRKYLSCIFLSFIFSAPFKTTTPCAAIRVVQLKVVPLVICFTSNNGILLSAGGEVRDQSDQRDRFAVIVYNNSRREFMFSANDGTVQHRHTYVSCSSKVCWLFRFILLNVVYVTSTSTLYETSTNVINT